MDYLKGLFDLTKLPAKFFVLFAVVLGFVLFSSEQVLEKIHIAQLTVEHGWIIGLVFVISAGLTAINLLIWIVNKLRFEWKFFRAKENLRTKLAFLDPQEKAVIREFVIRRQRSVEMPIDDPVVGGLLDAGILRLNKQLGNSALLTGRFAALSLGKYAERMLKLEYLDLSNEPTEEQTRFAQSNRPGWGDRF